jgi:hypothetical protein
MSGAEVIARFWDGLVRWATVDQPSLAAAQQREVIEARISRHPAADAVRALFDAAA